MGIFKEGFSNAVSTTDVFTPEQKKLLERARKLRAETGGGMVSVMGKARHYDQFGTELDPKTGLPKSRFPLIPVAVGGAVLIAMMIFLSK